MVGWCVGAPGPWVPKGPGWRTRGRCVEEPELVVVKPSVEEVVVGVPVILVGVGWMLVVCR